MSLSLDSRLIETRYADGLTSKTTYDAIGNETVKTDRANRQTKYEFDALQHLITVIDPTNSRTAYNYNELGSLVSETDANGHQTKYEYDGLQRRTAVIRPLGQRQTTIYDKVGNAVSMTDFNGKTTNYTYGLGNLLVGKQLADGSQTSIAYTITGQRQRVTDSRGITTYGYNSQGQVTTVTNPDGQQISYGYDSQGHLTSVTTAAGTTTYTYGTLNRLQQVTDAQGGITAYTYNDLGNLVSTKFANGITETRGYDTLNRLISVTNTNALSQVISSYAYTLDAVGNKLKVVENNGRQVDYTYDTRDRLLSEKITDPVAGIRTIAYAYDVVGNRLSVSDSVAGATTYSYNDNDWLVTTVTGGEQTQYTYDNNGSLLSKFHNANDRQTFIWNLDHKLAEVQTINSSGTHQSTYRYDADGNRVAQNVDGVNTNYLVDANRGLAQVALEYGVDGVRTSYTYASGVISQTSNNVQTFYINDGHSGVRFTASITGSITDAYSYDGYGNLLSGGLATGGDRYRGESRDSQTGLQYLRARYYDSSTGRLLSVDPFEGVLSHPTTRHRYLYGNNNPITYFDPSGKTAISMAEIGAIFSIIETLTITTAVQASIGQIARLSGDIKWAGTLSLVESNPTVDINAFRLGFNGGVSLLDLTTNSAEESPILHPNLVTRFRGKWVQIYGSVGAGIGIQDPFGGQSPGDISLDNNVVARSPRLFKATPVAFAGTSSFVSASSSIGSIKWFSAGFGIGGTTDFIDDKSLTSFDAGISLQEGISIPFSLLPS
jgi:RHS repeat-associated protein